MSTIEQRSQVRLRKMLSKGDGKMRMLLPLDRQEYFQPEQIEMLDRAFERALDVVRRLDLVAAEDEYAKTLLAECLIGVARDGEENPLRLINLAIVDFRVRWQNETKMEKNASSGMKR